MVWMFALGLLVGVVGAAFYESRQIVGTLKMFNPDDPDEGAYLFIELNRPAETLGTKKFVSFEVDTNSFNTRG